jgi:hypothetical protein
MMVENGGVSRRDGGCGGGMYLIARAGAVGVGLKYEFKPPGLRFSCAVGNRGGG